MVIEINVLLVTGKEKSKEITKFYKKWEAGST